MKKRISVLSICLYLLLGNLFAQDATLEETMNFIRLKTMDKGIWYSRNQSNPLTCESLDHHFTNLKSIELRYKTIVFTNDCTGATCTLNLGMINSIDLEGVKIKFSSTQRIVLVKKDNEYEQVNRPTVVTIAYGETDAPRLLKAFKHLFKLLEINLPGDKF
jgi:hypothetical protein